MKSNLMNKMQLLQSFSKSCSSYSEKENEIVLNRTPSGMLVEKVRVNPAD